MRRFDVAITCGLLLMTTGAIIGMSNDVHTIIVGAVLCWMALPCFWIANKLW